jgi:intracellular multiplication protein IcmO
MMAAGLGESVEGTYKELVQRKPTNADTPYMCILDEYGYYAVKGFAVVPAQARSLGFSVIFAGQDLPAFQKASKEEAASIGANTNIKICMKLEDPMETWEFFQKTAGESYVTKVDSFQTNAGSLLNNYMDSRSASSEKRQRIDLQDLKDQREGEAHIFFKSKIIRAKMFFANPPPPERMQVNQFLKVEPPLNRVIVDLEDRLERLAEVLSQDQGFTLPQDEGEEIQVVADSIASLPDTNPIERGLAALMALHGESEAPQQEEQVEEVMDEGKLNIFSKVALGESVKAMVGSGKLDQFIMPLINKGTAKNNIELLERLMGRSASQANPMTQEIIKDMTQATDYPPPVEGLLMPSEEIVAIANELCDYVTSLKTSSQEEGS